MVILQVCSIYLFHVLFVHRSSNFSVLHFNRNEWWNQFRLFYSNFILLFALNIFNLCAGSFSGLGFLSLYLSGKIKAFDRKGHVAKLCIVFMPLLFASLIGISRVDDYWHHWQDVFAGGLLGWCILNITISYKLTT